MSVVSETDSESDGNIGVTDPRSTEKIDIESYKPVKPTPIEPELLKRIEEYEEGVKDISDEKFDEVVKYIEFLKQNPS